MINITNLNKTFGDKKVLESLCPEYIVDSPSDILRIIERGI